MATGWIFLLLLRVSNVIHSWGLLIFLLAAVLSAALVVKAISEMWPSQDVMRGISKGIVLLLIVLVPVVFDPTTADTFNLPKYTVVIIGAIILVAIWLIRSAHLRRIEKPLTPLIFPISALLVWTFVATLASNNVRISLLGAYDSYEGLYSTLAFTVLFMVVYLSFRARDVRNLLTILFVAGGGLVVLYGVLQVHDRLAHGSSWDWVHWAPIQFASATIWSTFGNPNHLAGYLSMIVPIGIVLLILARSWLNRIVIGLILVGAILEIIETGSRGAWGASVLSLALLAVLFVSQVRRKAIAALVWLGSSLAVVGAACAVVLTSPFAREKLAAVFHSTSTDGPGQRVDLIRVAFRIANTSPIVGTGPDTYQALFPRYETPKLLLAYGPDPVANGPHNIFANYLAGEGYVGLFLWCCLLAVVVAVSVVAWRRLRARSTSDTDGSERATALLLAGVVAAIFAYVLQASFDALQIGLAFCFWVLLGILAVIARGVGVPGRLRSKSAGNGAILSDEEEFYELDHGEPALTATRWRANSSSRSERRLRNRQMAATVAATIAVATVGGLLIAGGIAPYQADHDYWFYSYNSQPATGSATTKATLEHQAVVALQSAVAENPWEPLYHVSFASYLESIVGTTSSSTENQILGAARAQFLLAVKLAPDNGQYLAAAAQLDLQLFKLTHNPSLHSEALILLHRAIVNNPFDQTFKASLAAATKR